MTSLKSQTQKTVFDSIDLTGQIPVVRSKVVEKNIVVHDLDAEQETNNNNNTIVKTEIIDRRLRKCEICLEEFSKYTCPGCKIKTCCLSCSQKHKKITGCSGTRNKTGFVAKSKFDNFHLLNDYRFLEEADRIADNAKRDMKNGPGKVPKKDQILFKNARKSGVQLYRMAKGMKRWKENRSYFNIKEQTLFWTMKLIFDDVKEEILTKHPETLTFRELLSKYISEEQLCSYTENRKKLLSDALAFQRGDIKIFFKRELDPGESNLRYSELDIDKTIKENLKDLAVLEYPIFYIVLPENAEKYTSENFIPVLESDSEDETLFEAEDNDDDETSLQPASKQRRIATE